MPNPEDSWLLMGLAMIAVVLASASEARRQIRERPRFILYRDVSLSLWFLAALCVASWLLSGRSLSALGLRNGETTMMALAWGAAAAIAAWHAMEVVRAARSERFRLKLRKKLESTGELARMLPRTPGERRAFYGVSVTAGITEEIAFRGFLIGALALVMPLPAAAGLAVLLFLLAHWYQGWGGIARITPITLALTALFVATGSLWPGIALHIAVDVAGGAAASLALREEGKSA